MLAQVAPAIDDIQEQLALFLEPPSFDALIVNQYALFSFVASRDAQLDPQRIVVPAATANVTERVLFPGLDGISRWLTRYYAPRANLSE